MKKIIISALVIGLLLSTSIVSVSAWEEEDQEFHVDQDTPIAGFSGVINPIWFKIIRNKIKFN